MDHNRNNEKKKKRQNSLALLFLLASAAVVFCGILSQILCEAMGLDRGLLMYLLGLVPAALVFFILYYAVVELEELRTLVRILAVLLLIALVLWNVFVGMAMVSRHLQKDQFIVYQFYAWTYPRREVEYMRAKSRPFGQGEPYYQYPDSVLEGFQQDREDLPPEVSAAFTERNKAKLVFGGYRLCRTLPVLSYRYGLWVNWLFLAVSAVWMAVAVILSFQVYGLWEKLLYLLCCLSFTLQMLLPLLGAFGKINDWWSYPFTGNWLLNVTYSAPQLALMMALIKTARPRPSMMMIPDDSYWYEILDED